MPDIGTYGELIEKIKTLIPSADFSDADCGTIEGDDWSIEIGLGPLDESVQMLQLAVRGGDEAAFVAADLISGLGLRAFDTGSPEGTIFPGPDILHGLQHWRSIRDRIRNQL